jgi:L,D-transpeptidase ErfK/SrfK
MVVIPRTRLASWLVALAIGGGCAHAPPVAEELVDPPLVTVAEPTCQPIQTADCGPSGDCRGVELIGASCFRFILPGESLIEIARQYDLGYNEIESANPGLDAFVPTPGATVSIPTAWIVPRAAASGKGARIVVNLSEMRLYVFPKAGAPMTFPVGVGSEGWTTPVGTFSVIQKQVNPPWYPPASIRKEEPDLPAMVPPGPDNPLGTHALRLSKGSILIHGTDKPFGVGRKASHGCLRLYPEDIPILYDRVPVGTQVTIVREPLKVGVRSGRIYVESHADDESKLDNLAEAKRLLAKRGLLGSVDSHKLDAAVRGVAGVPVDVTADRS